MNKRVYISSPRVTQALLIDQKINRRATGLVTWIGGDEPETEVERLLKELCEQSDIQATKNGWLFYHAYNN
ncbi:hypothetical protein [Halobacillus campisalis]|uniref:Uncharacterized protein n=1 Tax=Halobacillus campisalis TaxID=435909 RepID=A0ABW2K770_9BACI|nr:hypothetical protein [Halobacillus campisalis]